MDIIASLYKLISHFNKTFNTIITIILLSVMTGCIGGNAAPDTIVKLSDDLAPLSVQSTPAEIFIPTGLNEKVDIKFQGAFRALARGDSSSNYAVGTLAYHVQNNSIFMAGHAHHNAVAEFQVPDELSLAQNPKDIVVAKVLQDYVKILDKKQQGKQTNRITGMLVYDQSLLVNSEIWYDGGGKNKDNLQVFEKANSLRTSSYKGMLQLSGAARAAGYMSPIPQRWQTLLGGDYLTGWASNYSITSRYSQGPSVFVFDPADAITVNIEQSRQVPTNAKMVFPLQKGKELIPGGSSYASKVSPIWGALANARYGFILPNSDYFLAVGYHGGIHGGLGYKITQDNGRTCGGGCAKQSKDIYNYYWLFNIKDMVNAAEPHQVQPVAYGKWSHPHDRSGANRVIGASFDQYSNRLFVSLSNAARTGRYDRPPLILVYEITAK